MRSCLKKNPPRPLAVLCAAACLSTALHSQAQSDGPQGYQYAGEENSNVQLNGTSNVAYGANDAFHYVYNQNGSIDCSNDTFGDPIYGVRKACYVQPVITNTPPSVSFALPSGNPTVNDGYSLAATVNAEDSDGHIEGVKLFIDNQLVREELKAPYTWGANAFPDELNGLSAGTYTIKAVATDNDGDTAQASFTLTVRGAAVDIPGTVQAEDYTSYYDTTEGNSGGAYRTDQVDIETTSDNDGGHNVGWIAPNEWLEYPINITQTGHYELQARVASLNGGGLFTAEINGAPADQAITVNTTGGWQNWRTVSVPLGHHSTGHKTLRLQVQSGNFNLNWVKLVRANTPEPVCTLNTPAANIPTPFNLFTVIDTDLNRYEFCKADKWFEETNGQQVFHLFEGDNLAANVPGARVHARTEAGQGLKFKAGNTWHTFEARMKLSNKLDYTYTVAQLFAGCCGPQLRIEVKSNGRIHMGSRSNGNIRISDDKDYANGSRSFKIKIRTNGDQFEVYFNNAKKFEGRTDESKKGNSAALYHFRWGVYSNHIMTESLSNTVTELVRN